MADFLIIGGGVAGLSAGARLAELGRVVLLEAALPEEAEPEDGSQEASP